MDGTNCYINKCHTSRDREAAKASSLLVVGIPAFGDQTKFNSMLGKYGRTSVCDIWQWVQCADLGDSQTTCPSCTSLMIWTACEGPYMKHLKQVQVESYILKDLWIQQGDNIIWYPVTCLGHVWVLYMLKLRVDVIYFITVDAFSPCYLSVEPTLSRSGSRSASSWRHCTSVNS